MAGVRSEKGAFAGNWMSVVAPVQPKLFPAEGTPE
jgi:hypothetical protein